MHPELFNFYLPDLLGGYNIVVYSYAFLIVLGTVIAIVYTKYNVKKTLGITALSNTFFYLVFIVGFLGGKLFYFLQDPLFYFENFRFLQDNFSGGFVFYGSFVCIIPFIIWYLKTHKIPILPVLDILAITTTIIHSIGRLGCFAAGCCYGSHTDSHFGIVFPTTHGASVHPTQLYESSMLILIMSLLLVIKNRKQFQGQVFLIYLILYAFGRGVLEFFRGDDRGFIIENILSHSQFIALCLIAIAMYFYYKFYKQLNINTLNT